MKVVEFRGAIRASPRPGGLALARVAAGLQFFSQGAEIREERSFVDP